MIDLKKIVVRPGTSDEDVVRHLLVGKCYDLIEIPHAKLIFDLGANIGCASLFFAEKYPEAMIVAVEPDEENMAVLRKNIVNHRNIYPLQAGIWSDRKNLGTKKGYRDGREWAIQTYPDALGDVPGMSFMHLLGFLHSIGRIPAHIDLLKIDIEDAEKEMFRADNRWIAKCSNIIIELHSEESSRIFFEAMQSFVYDLRGIGELTVCENIQQRTPGLK